MSSCDAAAFRPLIERELRALLKLSPQAELGSRSPLELGVSSLGAITLQYRFESEFGADVSIADILGAATLEELCAHVAATGTLGGDAEVLV